MNEYDPHGSPPTAPSVTLPAPPPVFDQPFSVEQAFGRGWDVFKRHYGIMLGGVVLVIGISIAMSLVETVLNAIAAPAGSVVSLAGSIFLMPVLQTGLTFVAARATRREPIAFDHIFDGFRRYWPIVGVNLLVILLYFGAVLPFAGGIGLLVAFGSGSGANVFIIFGIALILAVVVLVLYARLAFAPIMCLDPAVGQGPVGSIQHSWRLTAPYWGRLVALHVLLWLVAAGSILLLCVGLPLLGMPLSLAVTGAAYAVLVGTPNDDSHCSNCGYDLQGLNSGVCPECGTMTGRGEAFPAVEQA